MSNEFEFLSPGIKIREIDESVIPAETVDDGPIIIGRTRKGPAMEPIRVRSLDAFIKTFGKPAPGGVPANSDVWRDGPNTSAPTYASYAAQAWLASGNGPCTIVRLLGDQDGNSASGNGIAGWQISTAIPNVAAASNSTAYGLWVIDSGSISSGVVATLIDAIDTTGVAEGDTFTITVPSAAGGDAVAHAINFLADVNAINGQGSTVNFGISFADASVAATAAARIIDAINGTSHAHVAYGTGDALSVLAAGTLGLTAALSDGETTKITLTLDDPGTAGNVAVLSTGTGFEVGSNLLKVTAFSGGANSTYGTGSLGAIFYCDTGYMTLSGTFPDGGASQISSASCFIKSNADSLGFAIDVYNSSGTKQNSTYKFNFDRSSSRYIRNVFNANPQKTNSDMTDSSDLKTYWLGETFERSLKKYVTSTTSGNQLGVLLPLHRKDNSSAKAGNWGCNRAKHSAAKTGWVITKHDGVATGFSAESQATNGSLFRFCSLHGGDDLQKDIMVAIEDIRLPANSNVNAYASFSVTVMDLAGNVLEKFAKCNLDTSSPNFIRTKIGDYYAESWSETDKKYSYDGDEPNHSNFIRIEIHDGRKTTGFSTADVPWGFTGPERPVGFAVSGSGTAFVALDGSSAITDCFVLGSGSVPGTQNDFDTSIVSGLDSTAGSADVARFVWPSLLLRDSGSEGGAANPFKVMWGIRPKISANSNIHDVDYVDYIRAFPSGYSSNQHVSTKSSGFEHSFIFTLDNIVIDNATNIVTYVSGSRKLDTSYTAKSGSAALLSKKVKQFVMPLYGGRHGLDITEMEPFREDLIDTYGTSNDAQNTLLYSVKKAIDAAGDPEVVPANLLLAPGFKHTSVTDKLMDIAEIRQDVLAIIDLQNDYISKYESTDAISTRRGSPSTAVTNINSRNIDNTFACAFYPWVQVIDVLNNSQRVWVPSSVAGLGAMAQSEAVSAAWFAPAGFNRGGLGALGGRSGPVVTQTRQRLDSDERDELYEANINPIATFPNEGVVVFGQKTLQAGSNSALSRINVRRLLIYLKARISVIARNILFDQNVPATWARFVGQAEPILASVKAKFGLTDYRLVLDETTTTAALIDKNVLYAQIYLKPARAIEYIAIDFIVTRTGASFV